LEKAQLIHKQLYQERCIESKTKGERKPKEPTCLGDYELAWNENLELPENWVLVPLGKVCMKITDGTHDTPKTVEHGIRYITAQHVKSGTIDFEQSFFLSEEEHKIIYSRCNPERGDVLLVNIGAGTATPALVDVDFEFSMKNIALLKPDRQIIDSQYLEYHQMFVRPRIFSQVSRGGAQPFIGLNLIKIIPFSLPPISEQKEIVTRIKCLFEKLELLKMLYQDTELYFNRLNQSILAKAFRGELVEQDLNDEPASVLLERIRAERQAQEGKKGRGARGKRKQASDQLDLPGIE
jgi:type I restriction enzyme S subunit